MKLGLQSRLLKAGRIAERIRGRYGSPMDEGELCRRLAPFGEGGGGGGGGGAKQALVRLSWPAVNQAGLDYHIGTRTLLHPSASFTSEACNGMQKGRKSAEKPPGYA